MAGEKENLEAFSSSSSPSVENETILLEVVLSLYPKLTPRYRFVVTPYQMSFEPPTETATNDSGSKRRASKSGRKSPPAPLRFDDVIGCDCMRGKTTDDRNAYLNVYAYPHRARNFASRKTRRRRRTVTLTFGRPAEEEEEKGQFSENFEKALVWQVLLSNLIRDAVPPAPALKYRDVSFLQMPPTRMVLVLVNPFGGPGNALHIFQERVIPMFAEAGIQYQLTVTEYQGHAKEIAKSLKLEDWYGVVIVSGDGLIHELINGLMDRDDWQTAIQLPIGILPGGSGNALCCSMLYRAKEPYLDNTVLHATFAVAKHIVMPMDLVAVDIASSGRRLYSFLAVGWGMIADVDIESEKYRSLGNARFTLGAVIRIVGLRKYKGKLSFLPIDGDYRLEKRRHSGHERSRRDGNTAVRQTTSPDSDDAMKRSASMFETTGCYTATGAVASEKSGKSEPEKSGKSEPEKSAKSEPEKSAKSAPEKSAPTTDPNAPDDDETRRGRTRRPAAEAGDEKESRRETVETPLLPPFSEPVPADWVTIVDDFVLLLAVYQTHIAQDMIAAPDSRLDDGFIYLTFVRGDPSRLKLVQLLTALQDGRPPVGDPSIDIVKVRAFRLEPLSPPGAMTVDGEAVEYGPIQAQMLSPIARVMAPKRYT